MNIALHKLALGQQSSPLQGSIHNVSFLLIPYLSKRQITGLQCVYSTIINVYVVVNFLSQVIFIFCFFFSTVLVYISIPKNKRKQKLPEIKKINDLQYKHYKVYHTISLLEAKKGLASFGTVIGTFCSESQTEFLRT